MLIVPTFLASSEIHGMGLFSAGNLSKGAIVWKYDDRADQRFTENEFSLMLDSLEDDNFDKFRSWSYCQNGVWILCGDNAKFFNHSEDNNVTEIDGIMSTIEDVKAGFELTCNYREFDDLSKNLTEKLFV